MVNEIEFYQDPRDPRSSRSLPHLVHTASIARNWKSGSPSRSSAARTFQDANAARPFTVDYGLRDRLAYIRPAASAPRTRRFRKLFVAQGFATTQGGARTRRLGNKVRVPDVYSFFKIESSVGQIVRNETGSPNRSSSSTQPRRRDLKTSRKRSTLPFTKKTTETTRRRRGQ